MQNRQPFDFEDGLAHALFLGFDVKRQTSVVGNVRFWLTSPGRKYGWVVHQPFGAPAGKPWQGGYHDYTSGTEETKRVFGATLAEALGHLSIAVYPKYEVHRESDLEHLNQLGVGYSYGTDDWPRAMR